MIPRVAAFAMCFIVAPNFLLGQANAQSLLPGQLTRCFALPNNAIAGISPSHSQMATAWGVNSIEYTTGLEYLLINSSEHPTLGLQQILIPTDKGSTTSKAQWSLEPASSYQLSQKVFLPPNFDWGGSNEGGKLGFGFGGGTATSGGEVKNDGFTARLTWRGNHNGTASAVIYSYAADRTQNLPYGDDFPLDNVTIPTGVWFEITMEVTTNSSAEQSDGSLKAWFNGEPALNVEGIQWQSEGENIVIDSLSYATFYGGGDSSWSPEYETYIQFSDICLSTPITKQRI